MRNRKAVVRPERLVVVMIVVIVFLFIAAVSYAFTTKDISHQTSVISTETLASLDVPLSDSLRQEQKDTDSDGLYDWEEVLWGTDVNNPDTDGDGVRDQEDTVSREVPQHDTGSHITTGSQNSEDTTVLTMSEIASRELISEYMFSLQNGETVTPEMQEQMAENALKKISPLLSTKNYSSDDFQSISSPTQEHKEKYMRTISDSLLTLIPVFENEPQTLLLLTQESERGRAVQEIKKLVTVVEDGVTTIVPLQVPNNALAIHTRLVNALNSYATGLHNFTYFESDPIRSAASMQTFDSVRTELRVAVLSFQTYVYENHK